MTWHPLFPYLCRTLLFNCYHFVQYMTRQIERGVEAPRYFFVLFSFYLYHLTGLI